MKVFRVVLACLALGLGACASAGGPNAEVDPIEPVNRGLFAVHDGIDTYFFAPVARGWRFITPLQLRDSVRNFFSNARFPVVFANDLLQGKLQAAGIETGRFAVNSTVGLAGFFDPATGWGLPRREEDFGQTLGYWGVGPGPYLVIPVLGPSTVRDALGGFVDSPLSVAPFFLDWWVTAAARLVYGINIRSYYIEEVEEAKASSFDYYAFMRNAYLNNRKLEIEDGDAEGMDRRFEELYYPDEAGDETSGETRDEAAHETQ
jgi:phospholipid-binding lipoprotein MlaA